MPNSLTTLYDTNRKLARCVRKHHWFYILAIGFICMLLISVLVINLFLKTSNNIDYQTSFKSIIFFVVMFDVIAIILRIQTRSFIESYHLAFFPISKWKKILFHFTLLLIDYKTLLYISVLGCFIFLFVKNSLYVATFASIFFFLLLLTVIITITLLIYSLVGEYLHKMGDKMQFIGLLFMAILLGIDLYGDYIFTKIPVISYAGNALYGLWIDNPQIVWKNLWMLLGSLGLPLALLFGISKFGWNQ